LQQNFISEIPVKWISQMRNLKEIYLFNNSLSSIPLGMFYNVSNIKILDVSYNRLTTFELWLIQIKVQISYQGNPVTRLTNDYGVDLSNYRSHITENIYLRSTTTILDIDDGIFEMYNRCGEINSTYPQLLMEAIKRIHETNFYLFNWDCSCKHYYLRKYLMTTGVINVCPLEQNFTYDEKCNYRSSFNDDVTPRLCKIQDWQPCDELDCVSEYLLALRCIDREEKQCHGSYVTERDQDDPSWDSNDTPSAIRADVPSQLD